jgi:hypothetical protein
VAGWTRILPSIFDLDGALRRIKPEKRRRALASRPDPELPFVDRLDARDGPFLLDTCVYLDAGKRKLPLEAARLLVAPSRLFHSAAVVSELTYALGRLDPGDQRTAANTAFVRETLGRIREERTILPDETVYAASGVLVGALTRTQSLAESERRRLLLDALIFLGARRAGLRLLTANIRHFDLMQQFLPDAKLAFYRPVVSGFAPEWLG